MGDIYLCDHGNKKFASLDNRDPNIARNLQDFLGSKNERQ